MLKARTSVFRCDQKLMLSLNFQERLVTRRVTVYIYAMIAPIAHKGLERLWEKDDPSKLPSEQVAKIMRILEALDTAKTLDPLRAVPGYKLHPLSGDLKGFWSITVTGNYRVIFWFENENAYEVDNTDYHQGEKT